MREEERQDYAARARAIGLVLACSFCGCAGYGMAARGALRAYEAGDKAGYARGLAKAAERWPLQGSAYRSEKDRKEAERQMEEDSSRKATAPR